MQSSRGTPGELRRARPEEFLILNINISNRIRDTVFELCQRAYLGVQLEAGSSLHDEERQTRPADILVPNWELGQPAAVDLSITSPALS